MQRLPFVIVQPFESVVTEHGDVVMRVCRALLGPVDAADAWSETFLAALRAYPSLRPDSNVRGWLVTIAHRKAIDETRRRARRPLPADSVPEVAFDEHSPPDEQLRAAVDQLPDKQRLAVIYRYLADLSYPEVAELIGSSEAAARRSAADGIASLRKRSTKGMT
jgi:RNA polymerase sigma factor (sigma-70 family)